MVITSCFLSQKAILIQQTSGLYLSKAFHLKVMSHQIEAVV